MLEPKYRKHLILRPILWADVVLFLVASLIFATLNTRLREVTRAVIAQSE